MAAKSSSKSSSESAAKAAPEITAADPRVQLSKYLNANKEDHYNFVQSVDYWVSTGSLALDRETGGIGVGVHRLAGPPGSGKSSEALEIARNFLAAVPNGRVLYVKSEGRFSKEIQTRSGLKFVWSADEWEAGSVFIFECNIYETIIGLLRELVLNNTTDARYLFIIDSADAVNLKNDLLKGVGEEKVAGAPLLTKRFLQKLSLAMAKYGHICLFLSQVTTEIKLDPYAKTPPRQTSGGGGMGLAHFANQVLEFQEWYEGDLILKDPESRVDRVKNPPIGHTVRVKIKKSDKETRYITVEIPIKHGQIGHSSIWREREVGDEMLVWGLVKKKGSWLTIAAQLNDELKEKGLEPLPEQIQGMGQLYGLLEQRQDVTEHLYQRFKEMMNKAR